MKLDADNILLVLSFLLSEESSDTSPVTSTAASVVSAFELPASGESLVALSTDVDSPFVVDVVSACDSASSLVAVSVGLLSDCVSVTSATKEPIKNYTYQV